MERQAGPGWASLPRGLGMWRSSVLCLQQEVSQSTQQAVPSDYAALCAQLWPTAVNGKGTGASILFKQRPGARVGTLGVLETGALLWLGSAVITATAIFSTQLTPDI